MKTQILFIMILLHLSNFVLGQKDTLGQSKYRCSLNLVKPPYLIKGEIFLLNDSSIILKQKGIRKNQVTIYTDTLISVPVNDIDKINIIKKGAPGIGLLIGGVVGTVAGGLIGFSEGDDEPGWFSLTAGEKASIGGILGFIPGALIGLVTGSAKLVIPIHGKNENYINRKAELTYFSIKK